MPPITMLLNTINNVKITTMILSVYGQLNETHTELLYIALSISFFYYCIGLTSTTFVSLTTSMNNIN